MNLISKDFFQFQIDFAVLWSKKQNMSYDEVLFKNTCLYVRLLGYSDINKPSMKNTRWIEILKNKPDENAKQADYFYNLYSEFENNKKPLSSLSSACFTFNYHKGNNIFELHFVNADPQGNFSKERAHVRLNELKNMFKKIKELNHEDALVKVETWILNTEAFKRLFPNEFTRQAKLLDTNLTQNYTHWGQFLTKDGKLKKNSAQNFLNTVKNSNFAHVNDYFPLPAKNSFLELDYFYKFYGIS